jgi:putative aldouronate transport system permease protein
MENTVDSSAGTTKPSIKNSGFKRFAKEVHKNRQLIILAMPAIIIVFIFSYIPFIGIVLPFKDYQFDKGLFGSDWIGFTNFKFLFSSGSAFTITRNTLCYNLVFIAISMVIPILLALILNQLTSRQVKFYQTVIFLPYFLSWIVISYIFFGFLSMDHGFLNSLLQTLSIKPVMWYNNASYWPIIIIIANTWQCTGYFTIIFYTGLISISPEYYEAAELDGATKFQQIIYISLPFLKSLAILLILLQVGKIFNANFGLFYNLPMSSPLTYSTTDVIDTYVYRALKNQGDVGMSSAAGLYQSCVGFVVVMISNWIIRKVSPEDSLF